MKYLHRMIVIISVLVSSACATSGVSGLRLPDPSDRQLKSGAKLIVLRDKSLPYFSIGTLVETGSRQDPLGKSGLSYLTASLLERGTKEMSALKLSEAFASFGTSFTFSVDNDYSFFSTQGLSEHQNQLVSLFLEVLQEPSFTVQEVNRRRNETVASVRRGYDSPHFVASRAFSQFLYGTHPYARSVSGSVRDLQSIRQKDIIRHYLQYYRPNQMSFVLVGDVNDETVDLIEKTLAKWENKLAEVPRAPAMIEGEGVQILLVHKPDLQQSEVRIGHIGVERKSPEYLPLSVATTILSGGFNSRLMREIRVKRGLTYGIRSGFDGRLERGPFAISASTRHEKVGELITETIKVFKDIHENGVTEQELKDAQGYMIGQFVRSVETSEDIAQMLLMLRFYGVDDTYLTEYAKNLRQLDTDDVNEAIRKHFKPNKLRIVVYGPSEKVIDQLRPLGAVEVRQVRQIY